MGLLSFIFRIPLKSSGILVGWHAFLPGLSRKGTDTGDASEIAISFHAFESEHGSVGFAAHLTLEAATRNLNAVYLLAVVLCQAVRG